MAEGWLVRVEVEAGKGEITPLVFVVAVADHRDALEAARASSDVTTERARPRAIDEPWPISKVELLAPVDGRTVGQLGIGPGGLWNLYKPSLTDRIHFAERL